MLSFLLYFRTFIGFYRQKPHCWGVITMPNHCKGVLFNQQWVPSLYSLVLLTKQVLFMYFLSLLPGLSLSLHLHDGLVQLYPILRLIDLWNLWRIKPPSAEAKRSFSACLSVKKIKIKHIFFHTSIHLRIHPIKSNQIL